MIFYTSQESRLLGIGPDKLVLLETQTKLLLRSHASSELRDWSSNCRGELVLEFRGAKPWLLLATSADSLKVVSAALWDSGAASRPIGTLPFQDDVVNFGE